VNYLCHSLQDLTCNKINAHRKTILPPVLYGCQIVFNIKGRADSVGIKTKVLWKIFGPNQQDVTHEWRKVHSKDLHYLCSLPNITWVIKSKRMRWAVYVASMGEKRNSYWVLVCLWGRDSSVSIATDYGLDGPGIESRWGRDFSHTSRPALRPTQPPVQGVPGLSRG
jgi:hypothetical protein